jgi:FtsZ-binding cell division protein ZapB
MFKTHDNKLSEHELSIGDCLEHLKEIDERLAAVESSSGSSGSGGEGEAAGTGAAPAGDLNDLINDGAFINGVVDNIMNTTNFASIVDSIIPLKEENEALKQQVDALNGQVDALNGQVDALNGQVDALNGQVEEWEERMRQLEDRVRSIGSSCHIQSENVTQENNSSAQETCIGVTHEEEEEKEEEEHEA